MKPAAVYIFHRLPAALFCAASLWLFLGAWPSSGPKGVRSVGSVNERSSSAAVKGVCVAMLSGHPGRMREDSTFVKRARILADSLGLDRATVFTGREMLAVLRSRGPFDYVAVFSHADTMGLIGRQRCGLYVERVKSLPFANRNGYGGGGKQAYSSDWVGQSSTFLNPGAVVVLPSCYTRPLAEEISRQVPCVVYASGGATGPEIVRHQGQPRETGRYTCPSGGFFAVTDGRSSPLSASVLDPREIWRAASSVNPQTAAER